MLFAISSIWASEPQDPLLIKDHVYKIKVLIAEFPVAIENHAIITSKNGLCLSDVRHEKKIQTNNPLHISSIENKLHINNKAIKQECIIIAPVDGSLSFNGRDYLGTFIVTLQDQKLLIINDIALEDYIFCVLRTESWPGWPVEINKAMAIACRSYAMATVLKAKKCQSPYHIKNTNSHQTYHGVHTNPMLRTAVEETKGMMLMHQQKPILAMFDTCCGGIIPAHIEDFDFQKAPYLARDYACHFCKRVKKVFTWQAEYDIKHLQEMFKSYIPEIGGLKDVKISKKDKAGLVQQVIVKSSRSHTTLSGKKVYSLCKNKIKSFSFSAQKKGKKIVFSGKGYGHHLGMCQWGARSMVEDGWDYRAILEFYYPGTRLARIT